MIFLHFFSFPLFFFLFFFWIVYGQVLCCHSSQGLGGGPWVAPPSPSPPYSSCCLIFPLSPMAPLKKQPLICISLSCITQNVIVVNIVPTNNCYNSTSTACFLCLRYSTLDPDRSKNSSTILGRLISSGFLVSMNTDRGVGHAQ